MKFLGNYDSKFKNRDAISSRGYEEQGIFDTLERFIYNENNNKQDENNNKQDGFFRNFLNNTRNRFFKVVAFAVTTSYIIKQVYDNYKLA